MKLIPLHVNIIIAQSNNVQAAKLELERQEKIMIEQIQLLSGIQTFERWELKGDELTVVVPEEKKEE